jgi:hypothetical protein
VIATPVNRVDYDAADDLRASTEFAYEHIRERVARGGRGWRGWPSAGILSQTAPDQEACTNFAAPHQRNGDER